MKHLRIGLWGFVAVLAVGAFCQATSAADLPDGVQRTDAEWMPEFYAFCVGLPQVKDPSIPEQARMLRELGFDGVGYPLWLDGSLEDKLRTIDQAGLKTFLMYTAINLKPGAKPYEAPLPDAIRKLKGRPVTVCVLLRGFPPGDPQGEKPAIKILRELGDVADEAGVRISVYHHVHDWTESLIYTLEIVKKVNHPQVGANFNLCHWLKVDGDKDYQSLLRNNASHIFAVTINGAQTGTDTWANGLIQPLDRGDFDNRELLKTLRDIGYRGPIGLMCYGIPDDARMHLQRSMKVWKAWESERRKK